MSIKPPALFILVIIFFYSCQKAEKVEGKMEGTWDRVVFDHNGSEQWSFTADNKIYIMLTLPNRLTFTGQEIVGDTVCVGNFTTDIVHYTHGALLNKNIFRVPAITVTDLTNFKYSGGNLDYTPYNTVWQVHKLNATVMILTTDVYSGKKGGLEQREFYKQ